MSDTLFQAVGGKPISQGPDAGGWNFGYHPNPKKSKEHLARLPYPHFSVSGAGLIAASDPGKDAFLWEAMIKVTGKHLDAHRQSIGCCTSEGWSSGTDYLQCVDIALKHKAQEFKPISHAVFYGLSREVAG